jgi:hypothetical protein
MSAASGSEAEHAMDGGTHHKKSSSKKKSKSGHHADAGTEAK